MENIGKILIISGTVLAIIGLLFLFWPKIPFLGKLPGDINIGIGSIRIFAPIATFLIISILLTLIVNVVIRWFR